VNACVIPTAIPALPGLIEIDVNTGAVTVRVAEPLTVPEEAVMLADPWASPVARPRVTVAIETAEEVQLAVLVRF
jgi:hypothetical protein